jgi:hypothetical protein
MENNYVIQFVSVNKKKGVPYVNFKIKGVKNGVAFSSSVSVDLSAAEVDFSHPMETIIADCATIAEKELKTSHFRFEGIHTI